MINKTHTGLTQGKPRNGFTLVELLVTITIILVLAALAFVANGKVRDNARQASAVSSLRQIGIAQLSYASDNNGAINTLRDTGEVGSGYEGGGNAWVSNTFWGRMQPYLFASTQTNNQSALQRDIKASLNILFNTSDVRTMAGTPFSGISAYADLSGLSVPIAFNAKIRPAWRQAPRRMAALGDPARTVYCTYGRYFIDHTNAATYTPLPAPGTNQRTIYFLPSRKAIICYLDGHVETESPPIPERLFE